jgi:large subunit ribosomal protein L10
MLIFQHNNVTATELNGIRRELTTALRKVDEAEGTAFSSFVKLQVIQTGIFASAMNVVEYYDASLAKTTGKGRKSHKHGLSVTAYETSKASAKKSPSELSTLLKGPLILLTLPTVSPAYLKSALTILSPSEKYPAPKRRTNPTYHEPAVQSGLQKLMLLGARAEGKTFDLEGARWIGSIEGGLTGLRSQLVWLLEQFGMGVTSTLEAAGKSLYFSLETHRSVLEEAEKPKEEAAVEKVEEKPAAS